MCSGKNCPCGYSDAIASFVKAITAVARVKALTDRYAAVGQDVPVCSIREALNKETK